jgi:hypothetical protein
VFSPVVDPFHDAPYRRYHVRLEPGGLEMCAAGSPVVVRALANGKVYTARVAAADHRGRGYWSKPSEQATPGEGRDAGLDRGQLADVV